MSRIWLPLAISLTAAATVAAELAHYYPELPDQVATHFDAEGFANGSMPKPQFVSMTLAVFAAIGGTLLALPVVLRMAPTWMINLPHKVYWLSPARAAGTRRRLALRVSWLMAGTFVFLAVVWHAMLQANVPPGGRLAMAWPLGLFLAFTGAWCGELLWRFGRLPDVPDEGTC